MASNTIAAAMLAEFEQEFGTTRRFLERVPEDQLGWRPHEKSMTAGQLAIHIAKTPQGVLWFSEPDEAEAPDFSAGRPEPQSLSEILAAVDEGASLVREKLPAIDDSRMQATFRVTQGGKQLMAMPRMAFLRGILLNHPYHHGGQLGVYLRLLGVAVPSSYGPSGDEGPRL